MEKNRLQLWLGWIVANATAALIMFGSKLAVQAQGTTESLDNTLIFSDFVIVPLLMGIISAYFWKDIGLKNWQYFVYALVNMGFGLAFSWLIMGEGYICLLIVSPLVLGFITAGTYTGKYMFRKKNRTINASAFALLFLILSIDSLSDHEYVNKVSDVMIVNAPPAKVWQYVVAYERIREKENYWLFQIGMPSPVQSTVDGYKAGCGRKCIFSNGYTFDEKMIVYKENEDLTFDITKQPRDPEIMGHIDILRGQFLLKDNGNGTTTLTGNSWYRLYVFPTWYYDLWAESITRNVHLRVMEHIKLLSEKKDV
jgi:hypothetical protein